MKRIITSLIWGMLCMTAVAASAADKNPSQLLIEAARASLAAAKTRVEGSKPAIADLEQAAASLKSAEEAYDKGKSLFGMGDLKPEAVLAVKHFTGMVDLSVALADSRAAGERAGAELEPLETQLESVKAKVRFFEERKAAIEKLRSDAARLPAAEKELETLKAANAKLSLQVDGLTADKLELYRKNESLTAEVARLTARLATLQPPKQPEVVAVPAAPPAPEPKPLPTAVPLKPAAPEAAAAVPAVKAPAVDLKPEPAPPAPQVRSEKPDEAPVTLVSPDIPVIVPATGNP